MSIEPNATIEVGLSGKFKIEAIGYNEDGSEAYRRTCADWFPNLITNRGLDTMGTNNNFLHSVQVGTGNTTPAFTDTGLAVYKAGQDLTGGNSGAQATAPYYGWYQTSYTFAVGAATGNLTEIGVADGTTGSVLNSRALILDGSGNPTTITILPTEQLVVTYQLNQYAPTTDVTGNVTIAGVNYAFTLRAAFVTDSSNWGRPDIQAGIQAIASTSSVCYATQTLGTITSTGPTGTVVTGAGTYTNGTYTPGNYYRDCTLNWTPSQGNASIGSLYFNSTHGKYQCNFTPVLPKDSTKSMSLTYRLSWARH